MRTIKSYEQTPIRSYSRPYSRDEVSHMIANQLNTDNKVFKDKYIKKVISSMKTLSENKFIYMARKNTNLDWLKIEDNKYIIRWQ